MTGPERQPQQKARKKRRRGPKPERASAVEAIKRAEPASITGPAELPLSPDELARLKSTFAFLREHRNTLKLRVNAAEDLLLNGKREPTHRGVCQHLLSKVEKAKVLQASERLPADKATELMAGVIRFAPEFPYVMRFLECVKASAGQKQATAALTQALGRIDFEEASSAQVRQVLELIVDIFPAHEQPVLLLSLLRGKAFRTAFDRSTEGMPEGLAQMLVPLRAVHQLLAGSERGRRSGRDKRSKPDPALLQEGALLLLRVDRKSLLEFNEPVRRRLFQLLCGLSADAVDVPREALLSLFESLRFSDPEERQSVVHGFVGLLLKAGFEKDAKGLLRAEIEAAKGNPGVAASHTQLLALLDRPRLGSLAFTAPPRNDEPAKGKSRNLPVPGVFHGAVDLRSQRRVRVLWVEPHDREQLAQDVQLWTRTLIPQTLLPVELDVTEKAPHPYVAVEQLEASFLRSLGHASAPQCKQHLLDLCRLAFSLDACGIALPDGALRRFAVSAEGRVWLADLTGARQQPAGRAGVTWLRETIAHLEEAAPALALSDDERQKIGDAGSVLELAQSLALV